MSLISLVSDLKTDWKNLLLEQNSELIRLSEIHDNQKKTYEPHLSILPPDNLIFNAFSFFNIKETKVLLLGQDPYIHKGEAQGLCFSVPVGIKVPPSLSNIFKELETNYGKRSNTDLSDWAEQGVLLLNAALTVLEGKSNINAKHWKNTTDCIIKDVSDRCQNVVFILWGNFAIAKKELIDEKKHLILTGVHPSPLSASRGFFGNNHFRIANEYLKENGKDEINWV